ncbi:MAG TPA: NEW3 domain-containing protein [Candidatus Limnocylindria bacterium]|nr:NEW3 domain-containing protein [Candidatus Limnocylindria bacterium]
MRVLRAGAAALLLGLTLAPAASAAVGLELTTAYPAITADPGSTVRFPVIVVTDQPTRVDLSVTSAPTGWTVRMRGAGSTVSAVNTTASPVASGSSTTQIQGTFTAEVTVPADVAPGRNQVVIQARTAAGITESLSLDLTTEQQSAGAVALITDFPNLRGSTTTDFRYNLTLTNDTNQQLTFGLEATGPQGWDVEAKPQGETQATTTTVDAGASQPIQVTVNPAADATAGTYEILVTAQGGPEPVTTTLTVEITGSYSLTLDTTDQRLNANATAGGKSTLNLLITNTGSAPLTNVKLTSTPPRGWKVTFDQETIAQIPAGNTGNTAQVIATIEPPANAVAGDYQLTIRATSTDESSAADSVEVRTTVDTSPIGLLIGIGILIVVAAGLFFVFQRYGRR